MCMHSSMMAVLERAPLSEELRYPDVRVLLTLKAMRALQLHEEVAWMNGTPHPDDIERPAVKSNPVGVG
ncbi:hypothetical protein AgCh_007492 [Apium graveolens]